MSNIFAALFAIPVLAGALNFLAALLRPVGAIFDGLVPVIQGIGQFVVWYVKELGTGFWIVLNNLHVLLLIATMVGGIAYATSIKEQHDCKTEVDKQRKFDEQKYKPKSDSIKRIPHLVTDESGATVMPRQVAPPLPAIARPPVRRIAPTHRRQQPSPALRFPGDGL